jgi:hypothetical protein
MKCSLDERIGVVDIEPDAIALGVVEIDPVRRSRSVSTNLDPPLAPSHVRRKRL